MGAPFSYCNMPSDWSLTTSSIISKAVYDSSVRPDAYGAAACPHIAASSAGRRTSFLGHCSVTGHSQLCPYSVIILRFPPNFVRQLSTKARRNCSNIGMAQIVGASWADIKSPLNSQPSPSMGAAAVDATSAVVLPGERDTLADNASNAGAIVPTVQGKRTIELSDPVHVSFEGFDGQLSEHLRDAPAPVSTSLFNSDQSLTVHAGKQLLAFPISSDI